MFIDRWMDKEDVEYIDNGILLSHKKNEIMPFAEAWMDLEILRVSEVSQTKTNIWYCLHVESKIWYNELITKQKQSHIIENRLMVTKGERGRDGNKLAV